MTTETTHRGDRAGASPRIDPAAVALAEQFAELGEPVSLRAAAELAERIERQGIADLYRMALNQSVSVRRARETRRLARRLRAQDAAK